jgi:pimeloyl-ACP methyl ester carboxylesterase
MFQNRRLSLRALAAAVVVACIPLSAVAATPAPLAGSKTDRALAARLPGFKSAVAEVNGTRIHYVVGGKGEPLVLLPGWPQTWWQYHKVMPELAKRYTVIAVDLRGMGGSSKPPAGYDKKTMAKDVHALTQRLGYERVYMTGHDIGAMVAFSFAANHPESTRKLALLDVPHPDENFTKLTMLPEIGKFGAKVDDEHPPYPWWFAFNQVQGLPEALLKGRFNLYQDWMFGYLAANPASIPEADRAVYRSAYSTPDAVRAGNGWYQTFMQDVKDMRTYRPLEMPVLGLGSTGYYWLQASVTPVAKNFKLVRIENSGHFMAEEQPAAVAKELIAFFD